MYNLLNSSNKPPFTSLVFWNDVFSIYMICSNHCATGYRIRYRIAYLKLPLILKHKPFCNRKILLQLYKSFIRSRLDYGAPIYNTASKSILKLPIPCPSISTWCLPHQPWIELMRRGCRTSSVLQKTHSNLKSHVWGISIPPSTNLKHNLPH